MSSCLLRVGDLQNIGFSSLVPQGRQPLDETLALFLFFSWLLHCGICLLAAPLLLSAALCHSGTGVFPRWLSDIEKAFFPSLLPPQSCIVEELPVPGESNCL